jgi:anti-anti-sigma factor
MTASGSGPRGRRVQPSHELKGEARSNELGPRRAIESLPCSGANEARAFCGYLHESLVFVLKGQVRYMTARALRSVLDALLEEDANEAVIIDLRELDSIDSTGMGLLARIGRATLNHGRRSVIVSPVKDVTTCLRSASFDKLFIMTEHWPFEKEPRLSEVPLDGKELLPDVMGRVMLEAHRDLIAMSEENRVAFSEVVAALEADLNRKTN